MGLLRSLDHMPAVEIWRALRREAEPRGGQQESRNLAWLMRPGRAKDWKEAGRFLREWGRILKEESAMIEDDATLMSDRLKTVAMQELMPQKGRHEVDRKPSEWRNSYKEVRAYLLDQVAQDKNGVRSQYLPWTRYRHQRGGRRRRNGAGGGPRPGDW